MRTLNFNGTTWIDVQGTKEEDLEELKEKFKLHPLIRKQFLPSIQRPKIEEHSGQLFVVLHFPVYNKKTRMTKPVELDFIVTQDTLITSHDKEIPELEIFFSDCQLQKYHQNNYFKSSAHLLFNLIDYLIDSCLPMLDHVGEKIDKIGNNVFAGKEKEMLSEIAIVKKDLIDFGRSIKPQQSVLNILEKKARRFFPQRTTSLAQETIGSFHRVIYVLENQKELINSLEQTNNSLLSYKLNDIVKFLTVLSFITFPLSVIVGFFGMNIFSNIPIVENNLAWLVILIFMTTVTVAMIIYFRRRKWL